MCTDQVEVSDLDLRTQDRGFEDRAERIRDCLSILLGDTRATIQKRGIGDGLAGY